MYSVSQSDARLVFGRHSFLLSEGGGKFCSKRLAVAGVERFPWLLLGYWDGHYTRTWPSASASAQVAKALAVGA